MLCSLEDPFGHHPEGDKGKKGCHLSRHIWVRLSPLEAYAGAARLLKGQPPERSTILTGAVGDPCEGRDGLSESIARCQPMGPQALDHPAVPQDEGGADLPTP